MPTALPSCSSRQPRRYHLVDHDSDFDVYRRLRREPFRHVPLG
ncbi:hypothetical protein [Synechococcus sp. CBW1006]|nr:hypothetical protein [Synechococcus sp. CBW1006]